MNWKLCKFVGKNGAFPTPYDIVETSPEYLRENCRLGYRSTWIYELSHRIIQGEIVLEKMENKFNSRNDIYKELRKIKGVGDFAANNILQLMGYFDSHPYDTETVRLFQQDFSVKS